jgi:hypothetical protein
MYTLTVPPVSVCIRSPVATVMLHAGPAWRSSPDSSLRSPTGPRPQGLHNFQAVSEEPQTAGAGVRRLRSVVMHAMHTCSARHPGRPPRRERRELMAHCASSLPPKPCTHRHCPALAGGHDDSGMCALHRSEWHSHLRLHFQLPSKRLGRCTQRESNARPLRTLLCCVWRHAARQAAAAAGPPPFRLGFPDGQTVSHPTQRLRASAGRRAAWCALDIYRCVASAVEGHAKTRSQFEGGAWPSPCWTPCSGAPPSCRLAQP